VRVEISRPTYPERGPDALKDDIYVSPYTLRVKSCNVKQGLLPPQTHWRLMFDRVVVQVRQSCGSARQDCLQRTADRHVSRCLPSPAAHYAGNGRRHQGPDAEQAYGASAGLPAKQSVKMSPGLGILQGSKLLPSTSPSPEPGKTVIKGDERGHDVLASIEQLSAQLANWHGPGAAQPRAYPRSKPRRPLSAPSARSCWKPGAMDGGGEAATVRLGQARGDGAQAAEAAAAAAAASPVDADEHLGQEKRASPGAEAVAQGAQCRRAASTFDAGASAPVGSRSDAKAQSAEVRLLVCCVAQGWCVRLRRLSLPGLGCCLPSGPEARAELM